MANPKGRNPNVKLRELPHRGWWIAWCHEPGCEWVDANPGKTYVEGLARAHRAKHRKATDHG